MSWESEGVALLTASLMRPFGLAVAAWLILRVLRVRHPASRHAVWTAVLIGMMMLPVVSVITPHWKLPVLPRKHDTTAQALAPVPTAFTGSEPIDKTQTTTASKVSSGKQAAFEWPAAQALVLWCYLAGLFAMVTYRVVGWALLWRVVSGSKRLRSRRLRESADVLTPVAVGVMRPVVILPVGWRSWNANTRRAVLAHEFAHLRRHDTLVSALARLVQCVFWFHPLAWWVSQKISNLAELACDAAVLERVDDPVGYSRILLEFAGAVNRAGRRVALPGLAMAAGSGMDRRIDQVFELSSGRLRKLSRPGVLLGMLGVPVMCLAATVGLGETALETSALPARRAAPVTAPSQPPVFDAPVIKPPMARRIVAQQRAVPQTVAQPAPAVTPKFEVVSIKPCKAVPVVRGRKGGSGSRISGSPTRLSAECVTLATLIRSGYLEFANGRGLSESSGTAPQMSRRHLMQAIEGGPAWIDSDRYTIDAKAEGTESVAMMRGPMMQGLLEDRFKLKMHRETKETAVYALTLAQGGLRAPVAKEGNCVTEEGLFAKGPAGPMPGGSSPPPLCGGFLHGPDGSDRSYRQTMTGLCAELSTLLDRDVVDKTGILGVFDIEMTLSLSDLFPGSQSDPRLAELLASAPNSTDPAGSSIFAAVQKLGLRLDPAKSPSEFIVIDHVERPSEN